MIFSIGTRMYTVRRKWNLRSKGEALDGLCDYSNRTIWLDGQLAEETIVDVLRHEHAHAWQFEVGCPSNHEDNAAFTSTVSDAFDEQFSLQGGFQGLLQVPIEGVRPASPDGEKPGQICNLSMADRVECGHCHATIMDGSIHTGQPILASAGVFMLDRGFRCPVCNSVQVWQERSTPDGQPLGQYHRVRMLAGAEADAWAKSHPVKCEYNLN